MPDSPRKIRILTVDDHPLFRQGVAAVIDGRDDMEVIAEGGNGIEAVELYRRHLPDVVIMDLRMPALGGVEAISIIKSEFPAARILVMTTYRGDVEALRALRAGAQGYLLKSAIDEDVGQAIVQVFAGQKFVPREVSAALAAHAIEGELSVREMEVLRLVASGYSNPLVAQTLSISEATVKSHMKNIMAKLNARDRTHAVMIAVRRGILTD
jgi:DNA-binding NarL/FixJ family response regulator